MTLPADPNARAIKTLDKDLRRIGLLEQGLVFTARPLIGPGIALAFLAIVGLAALAVMGTQPGALVVIAAAVIGGYMALNIGANDVANNMGPAVGANAVTLAGALAIAAVCETAGALLAGGDVVDTIARGIVAPESVAAPRVFVWAMMAALAAGALWINLATWLGAPVSTTHSIVGGVLGSGIAAAGFAAVNWPVIGRIAASWVISPVLGGMLAALVLAFINSRIIYRDDKLAAARIWVPVLIGVMGGVFAAYMAMKGTARLVSLGPGQAMLLGVAVAVPLTLAMRPVIRRRARGLENRTRSLKPLFAIPLLCAAGLMSFAHGANDVSNAVGPLAAIVHAVLNGGGAEDGIAIPLWVMVIGALGLSFGLVLFGPKLIHLVGNEITRLNAMRAYCISLSAAVVVILASWLGMPVSSTHIAIGGIFGVGFYREWYHEQVLKENRDLALPVEERTRRKVVRRAHLLTILMAWVVTVPATAMLSGVLFLGLVLLGG